MLVYAHYNAKWVMANFVLNIVKVTSYIKVKILYYCTIHFNLYTILYLLQKGNGAINLRKCLLGFKEKLTLFKKQLNNLLINILGLPKISCGFCH